MSSSRKQHFIEALKAHYQETISVAGRAESTAAETADAIRGEATRKDDAKAAIEEGRLATGHRRRRQRAIRELEQLIAFAARGLPQFPRASAVSVGALVDVSVEGDDGPEERTLFLLPVGAGTELTGPGGDGFISVVSPDSPLGRAIQGVHVGDEVEVVIKGREREWQVVDVY
jgi:transcription elongation GreA/GreB family factor